MRAVWVVFVDIVIFIARLLFSSSSLTIMVVGRPLTNGVSMQVYGAIAQVRSANKRY